MHNRRSPFPLIAILAGALSVLGLGVGWHLRESPSPCGPIADAAADMAQHLTGSHEPVLGIAHNAAASTKEVRRAIDCGAAVIEIDVIEQDGQLRASHDRAAASPESEDPLLGEIWPVAAEATMIKLDPKFPSPELTNLLVAFLQDPARSSGTKVTVTTNDVDMLQTLRERAPEVQRFLTMETSEQLATLRDDSRLLELIHGVSIEQALIDQSSVDWLDSKQLSIWAWTVTDPLRAQELVDLGVEGITTDNLALLEYLNAADAS